MHPYATDSAERQQVPLYLAVLAILAAWSFSTFLRSHHFEVAWYIDAPSVLAFYQIFHTAFDRTVWRRVRSLGVVKVPDLEGDWSGYLTTSFDDHAAKVGATAQIAQTWTRISIVLRTETSESQSLVGSLLIDTPYGRVLSYQYLNEPLPDAPESMNIHHGTARLTLSSSGRTLKGEYYSARGRETNGFLRLEKSSSSS